MATPWLTLQAATLALATAVLAVGGGPTRPAAPEADAFSQRLNAAPSAPRRFENTPPPRFSQTAQAFSQPSVSTDPPGDPLLTQELRYALEAVLLQAGDTSDPQRRKQRLAGWIARNFPAELAARAWALAERYLDYRMALAEEDAPLVSTDPDLLRATLLARQTLRQQFFDAAEYQALFAREDELDRYTLARLEVLHHAELTPEQRLRALQATEALLRPEHRAERQSATEHLTVAAQTARFNAQHIDSAQRYTARNAAYGPAAAQALAALDQAEQDWQQRLDLYRQARDGDAFALERLRLQPFSAQELLRVQGALALRELQGTAFSAMETP